MEKGKINLSEFSPFILFIASFFVVELLFEWLVSTRFFAASLMALITFLIEVSILQKDFKPSKSQKKRLGFFSGLNTLMFIIIFITVLIDWNRIFPDVVRITLVIFSVFIFLVIMFRAMRVFNNIKESLSAGSSK